MVCSNNGLACTNNGQCGGGTCGPADLFCTVVNRWREMDLAWRAPLGAL